MPFCEACLAKGLREDCEVVFSAKRCQIPEIGMQIGIAFESLQDGSLCAVEPPCECVASRRNAGQKQEIGTTAQSAPSA